MTYEALTDRLDAMTDTTVKDYQNKVITDTRYPMRFIRMPRLRQLARVCAGENWQALTEREDYETFEALLTVGLAVAYARVPFEEKEPYLRRLLPHLDSWAMTDCIVPTLKLKPREREAAWRFTEECLASEAEYTRRFGVIMLLDYFLTPEDMPRTAQALCRIRDPRYYVGMAVAWCLAEMAVTDYPRVAEILDSGVLSAFVHNKAIQKMLESYRIPAQQKIQLREKKRK